MDGLDELADVVGGSCASLDADVACGHSIEETLRLAGRVGADLIVVARPPRRRCQDPFAEKIARHAATSVLVVSGT